MVENFTLVLTSNKVAYTRKYATFMISVVRQCEKKDGNITGIQILLDVRKCQILY